MATKRTLLKHIHRSALLPVLMLLCGLLIVPINYKVGAGIKAMACWWMLLVPCGDMRINRRRKLWLARQAFFFVAGVINALPLFR